MKYFTVESFVREALPIFKQAEDIYIVFMAEDAKPDRFNKYNAHPLLFVVKYKGKSQIYEHDEICEMFEDTISISVSKPSNITEGVACLKIGTSYEYSEKLECEFHPRKYIAVSNNVIDRVVKINSELVEKAKPEVLDI